MKKGPSGSRPGEVKPSASGQKVQASGGARKAPVSGGASPSSRGAVARKDDSMMKKLKDAEKGLAIKKVNGMYVPEGYRMREIKPAKNYDVVSMAKAMNDDFAPKMKELFDTETEAAIEAINTGIYVGWRCPDFKHDCQRVFKTSRCFCDHRLSEHASFNGLSVKVPCKVPGCECKAYQWIPNKPEDIGEFWLPKRPGFDAAAWRAKCKCKHTHNFHAPNRPLRCKMSGCSCGAFYSDFLCAACDRHWEEHQTFFDSEQTRRQEGLPVGTDWLPFAEMPELRNIALSGNEEDDSRYLALREMDPIPANALTGNDAPVQLGGSGQRQIGYGPDRGQGGRNQPGPSGQSGRGKGGSGFKPVWD